LIKKCISLKLYFGSHPIRCIASVYFSYLYHCGNRYFIPEDGDTEANPNVFLAPKPSRPGYPPTLEQIKSSFPLPGRYHFRFKTTLIPGVDKGPAVWMDCVDDTQPVAVYKNSIIAKVTRISL